MTHVQEDLVMTEEPVSPATNEQLTRYPNHWGLLHRTGFLLSRVYRIVRPYEVVALIFGLMVTATMWRFGFPLSWRFALALFYKGTGLVGVVLIIGAIVAGTEYSLKNRKLSGCVTYIRERYLNVHFTILSLRRVLSVLAVLYFFLHLKHVILFINFRNYDEFLWNLDRTLHFGVQPNIILLESFGKLHSFALFVDWLYVQYFDVKFFGTIPFLLQIRGTRLAERVIFSMALLWACGGALYLAVPADGPCFSVLSHHSVPEGMRRHVFAYPILDEVPKSYESAYADAKIWHAKLFQENLWKARHGLLFEKRIPNMFYGIAAMPSLHVAAVVFLSIAYFSLSSVAGICMVLFSAFIIFGSVFLQWHYAVDGYAGVILAVAAYNAGRWIKDRTESTNESSTNS